MSIYYSCSPALLNVNKINKCNLMKNIRSWIQLCHPSATHIIIILVAENPYAMAYLFILKSLVLAKVSI